MARGGRLRGWLRRPRGFRPLLRSSLARVYQIDQRLLVMREVATGGRDRMLETTRVSAAIAAVVPAPEGSVLYADRDPVGPGTVDVAGQAVGAPDACLLAFRDDAPGANWMHPCLYALVEVSTGRLVTTVPADRPPVFGFLPASWIVVADPEGRADLIRPPDRQDTP